MMTDPKPNDPEIISEIVPEVVIDAEIVPDAPPPLPEPDYDERGNPSLDYLRSKIEGRYATSVGSAELAGETPQGRTLAEQEAERAKKAADKLAEIRRSLGQG